MSQASKSCAESRVLHGVGMGIEDHLCGANFDDTHTLPFEEILGLQQASCRPGQDQAVRIWAS